MNLPSHMVDRMIDQLEAFSAKTLGEGPTSTSKFMGRLVELLVNEHSFGEDVAATVVLNASFPMAGVELTPEQFERLAAMAATNINRIYEHMIDVGFGGSEDLARWVGRQFQS